MIITFLCKIFNICQHENWVKDNRGRDFYYEISHYNEDSKGDPTIKDIEVYKICNSCYEKKIFYEKRNFNLCSVNDFIRYVRLKYAECLTMDDFISKL